MSRKDFVLIADSIKASREELKGDQANDGPVLSESQWDYIFGRITNNFVRKLAQANDAFDSERFKRACK